MEALAAGMAIAIVFVYFRVYPLLFKHFINFIKSKDSDVFPGIYFTVFAILSTILLTVLCLIGMIIAFEDIDDNLLFTILALTAVISLSFLSIIYLTIRKKTD